MAFKIPQVPSSVLTVHGLYSRSFGILNAVESSVTLSNYYVLTDLYKKPLRGNFMHIALDIGIIIVTKVLPDAIYFFID